MKRFLHWLCSRLPVHADGHLYHGDGSLYMGRWDFFRTKLFWPRLHHIATADLDRHLHDHPSAYFSLVLHGGYTEARPVTIDPCFSWYPAGPNSDELREDLVLNERGPGSIAFRRATDRHLIVEVLPDTWTLFIFLGGKQHWWGFYTPRGKVWWKDYESCHDAGQQLKEAA